MSPRRRSLLLAAAVVVAALASACTPKLEYLRADPSFTHAALAKGRVAILPVASNTEQVCDEELSRMEGQISSLISELREGVRPVPLSTVGAVLASQDRGAGSPSAAFSATGSLPPDRVRALGASFEARYLVAARITRYVTLTFDSEREEEETDGKHKRIIRYQQWNHEATLSGELSVFDGTTGETVWEGRHTASRTNTNEQRAHRGLGAAIVQTAISAATGTLGYPDPPPASEVSRDLFAAMIANWPEAD